MELDLGIVSIMDFYYYINYPYNYIGEAITEWEYAKLAERE